MTVAILPPARRRHAGAGAGLPGPGPRRARRARVAVLVAAVLVGTACTAAPEATPRYRDPSAPVDARVADLLDRMTLDEKLGQMTLVENGSLGPADVTERGIGAVLSGGGGAPRPNTPDAWRDMVASFQDAAAATRLGIPLLYGVDAVHGHNNLRGAVVFPHNVGLGAAGDPGLVEAIGRATAVETAATGIRWTYAPVLAVPQDVRWGRTYEGYGQDPDLVAHLGAALVRGLQGDDLADETAVVATPKHWVGDGGTGWDTSTVDGYRIDQGVTLADEDELRAVHVAPYPAAFAAGAVTVMATYSGWENGKVHGDRYLLTDVLRGELGFEGLVVSDWGAVDQVVPGDLYASVVQSVDAGVDLVMVPSEFELFLTALRGAVEQGDVDESRIDEAVSRVLAVKFRMGLFEATTTSPGLVERIGSPEHRDLAREAVARSVTLLETDGETLPLDVDAAEPVLLAGIAADDVGIQSGGWTISWQGDTGDVTDGTTVLDGLREALAGGVEYDRSGRFRSREERASVGIAVVGERPYAEGRGDSADLRLLETEVDVVRRLRARVDRLVVVLITGRPLVLDEVADLADVLAVAWLPGSEGDGVVDVLTGAEPVTGRTPYAWPRRVDVLDRPAADRCDGIVYALGHGLDLTGAPLSPAVPCDGGRG